MSNLAAAGESMAPSNRPTSDSKLVHIVEELEKHGGALATVAELLDQKAELMAGPAGRDPVPDQPTEPSLYARIASVMLRMNQSITTLHGVNDRL